MSLHKESKVLKRITLKSETEDISMALMECLEQGYKQLDVAEPVWVSKHRNQLGKFLSTRFLQEDFVEPVNFDYLQVEIEIE